MSATSKTIKLKEAIKILEQHNKWRRSEEVNPNKLMIDPKLLGLAIDKIVDEFKTIENKIKRD